MFTQEVQDSLRDFFGGVRVPGQDGAAEKGERRNTTDATMESDEKPLAGFKSSGFKSSFKPISAVPLATASAAEDLDGEAMEDVDGEALDDVDGDAMEEDVDGEAIDDADGEAMDEDLDGEEM